HDSPMRPASWRRLKRKRRRWKGRTAHDDGKVWALDAHRIDRRRDSGAFRLLRDAAPDRHAAERTYQPADTGRAILRDDFREYPPGHGDWPVHHPDLGGRSQWLAHRQSLAPGRRAWRLHTRAQAGSRK